MDNSIHTLCRIIYLRNIYWFKNIKSVSKDQLETSIDIIKIQNNVLYLIKSENQKMLN